jgi:hypothetical protein
MSVPYLTDYVRHVRINSEWGAPLFFNTQAYMILKKLPKLRSIEVAVKDRLVGSEWNKLQHVCMQQLWTMLEDLQLETITLTTPTLKVLSKLI